eukprot:TRINITY_DN59790_c0_g1_i1.p1 TRINITY_DN59790_c0_g1~~TRINITY_DN59790_c0_g1_i1.p1  ORF type:complete len:194 (+),score=29.01 TRINITY_DN59790_c0_g1_i1:229-810(+)
MLRLVVLVWAFSAWGCSGEYGAFDPGGSVGGLNIRTDVKAEIAAMVASGSLALLPHDDGDDHIDGAHGRAGASATASTHAPIQNQEQAGDGQALKKQQVKLVLQELVRVIQSPENNGFRHALAAEVAATGGPLTAQTFDRVWQAKILVEVCRRHGMTLAKFPTVLTQFETDREVQTLLSRYNQAMHSMRQTLS